MKIPLSDQIAEAERHRDELQAAVAKRPDLVGRLHAAEGMCLTMRLVQSIETDLRQFMKTQRVST